jgi:hypothetical protein
VNPSPYLILFKHIHIHYTRLPLFLLRFPDVNIRILCWLIYVNYITLQCGSQTTAASCNIFSNSLFTNHLIIRRYRVWVTDISVKWTTSTKRIRHHIKKVLSTREFYCTKKFCSIHITKFTVQKKYVQIRAICSKRWCFWHLFSRLLVRISVETSTMLSRVQANPGLVSLMWAILLPSTSHAIHYTLAPPSSGCQLLLLKQVASGCAWCLLRSFFEPEDGGDTFRRNVGWLSTDYTVLYPRR